MPVSARASHVYMPGVKEASLAACRSAVDSVVVTVEMLGRDFPGCFNYTSLRATVHAMRDAADVLASSLKIIAAEGKVGRWIGTDFCKSVEHFKKVHAQLPQALSELENRVEDSRPLTQHLDSVKARILSLLPSDKSQLAAPLDGHRIISEHESAQQVSALPRANART